MELYNSYYNYIDLSKQYRRFASLKIDTLNYLEGESLEIKISISKIFLLYTNKKSVSGDDVIIKMLG